VCSEQRRIASEFASENFKNDKEVVIKDVTHDMSAKSLEMASNFLQGDKCVALTAVEVNGSNMRHFQGGCRKKRALPSRPSPRVV
jgi:hypothetical protein